VAGTTSGAGKSLVTTALARWLHQQGISVHPFKAVNMSLNSIAVDGGEIAVAQWVQCQAAGISPSALANPVLVKSEGPGRVEVVVHGRVRYRLRSWKDEMPRVAKDLAPVIQDDLEKLRRDGYFVLAEGAGSPAEVNLRRTDLSNMFVARSLNCPAILVADLERGGALAQVVGTLELLPKSDRSRFSGIVLNRLRGDPSLLAEARSFLRRRTGLPVLGVLPHIDPVAGRLPPEDSLDISSDRKNARSPTFVRLGIVRVPHASNFSDFEGFYRLWGISLEWLEDPPEPSGWDAMILPGSRRTRDDLQWLEDRGWVDVLHELHHRGTRIVGICGGYQMLGRELRDPEGFEGPPGRSPGLGLLPLVTDFTDPKIVRTIVVEPLSDNPCFSPGQRWMAYEIRRGRTRRTQDTPALFRLRADTHRPEYDGARTGDATVWGSALHGLFVEPARALALARWACPETHRRRHIRVRRTRGSTGGSRPSATAPLLGQGLERTIQALTQDIMGAFDQRRLQAVLGLRGGPS
jgi:adenosylcobyric acid synthase